MNSFLWESGKIIFQLRCHGSIQKLACQLASTKSTKLLSQTPWENNASAQPVEGTAAALVESGCKGGTAGRRAPSRLNTQVFHKPLYSPKTMLLLRQMLPEGEERVIPGMGTRYLWSVCSYAIYTVTFG